MPFPAPKKVVKEFGNDHVSKEIEPFVRDKVDYLFEKTRGLREVLLPKWIRIYKGVPKEREKSFPWPGASNLIPQLAATHSDELLSRVMAIYQDDPLFVGKLLGQVPPEEDDQREILEKFLSDIAIEPEELDLYRVEQTWFSSAIRYGTGIVAFPWEYIVEQQMSYIPGASGEGERNNFIEITKRDGPRPVNVPLDCWLIDPETPSLNNAKFVARRLSYDKQELESKLDHPEIYNIDTLKEVIAGGSDRDMPLHAQAEQERPKEMASSNAPASGKWDIWECWYLWRKDGRNFRLVSHYHKNTDKFIGHIFNPYPDNMEPFEDAKLAYDDEQYYGYGFMEMLESYQLEIATTHNQRIDNRNLANTGIFRINKNSKLASILVIHPGALIPADKDEFEAVNKASLSQQITTEDEQLTLGLAKDRSGVDPAIGGAGGGIVNSKRGIYSAQGTSVAMQQQNNRNNLRTSDMRSSHVRLGRKILTMYAHFGLGNKIRRWGDDADGLKKGLDNYKTGKLGLAIRPATASVNKELEKQNDILLSNTLNALYQSDMQLIQSMGMQGMPPQLQQYVMEVLQAKQALMKRLVKNFGHADSSRLVPMPAFLKEQRNAAISGGNNPQAGPAQSANSGTIPVGNGQLGGGIPSSMPQGQPGNSGEPAGDGPQ
jgi:hypothetical protein